MMSNLAALSATGKKLTGKKLVGENLIHQELTRGRSHQKRQRQSIASRVFEEFEEMSTWQSESQIRCE